MQLQSGISSVLHNLRNYGGVKDRRIFDTLSVIPEG